MAHTSENLYWFIHHSNPNYTTRNTTGVDMSYVDLSLQNAGLFLVDNPKTKMWDVLGKNILPTVNRDLDLLLKMTPAQYFDELASDAFKAFYQTFIASYGLKTIAGTAASLKQIWVNAAKQIDCLVITISGVDYYYDAQGNSLTGTAADSLCTHITPANYHYLNEVGGFSDYMASTLSGGQLHPQVALSGATANITDIIVSPGMNISQYIGTYNSTAYKWDTAGNEITTMDKALTLVSQIEIGSY